MQRRCCSLRCATSRPRHVAGRRWRHRASRSRPSTDPDVIFLNIGLPVINGYVVARRLRDMSGMHRVDHAASTEGGRTRIVARRARPDATVTSTKPRCTGGARRAAGDDRQGPSARRSEASTPRTRRIDSGSGLVLTAARCTALSGSSSASPTGRATAQPDVTGRSARRQISRIMPPKISPWIG